MVWRVLAWTKSFSKLTAQSFWPKICVHAVTPSKYRYQIPFSMFFIFSENYWSLLNHFKIRANFFHLVLKTYKDFLVYFQIYSSNFSIWKSHQATIRKRINLRVNDKNRAEDNDLQFDEVKKSIFRFAVHKCYSVSLVFGRIKKVGTTAAIVTMLRSATVKCNEYENFHIHEVIFSSSLLLSVICIKLKTAERDNYPKKSVMHLEVVIHGRVVLFHYFNYFMMLLLSLVWRGRKDNFTCCTFRLVSVGLR